MVQIANKPFTQLTNLNILDEFRIQGVLVNPGGGKDIVEITAEYDQELDDDIIIAVGTFDINLISAASAIKPIVIRAGGSSTITLVPDGSDTVGTTTVAENTSVTLTPFNNTTWLQI